MLFKRKLGQYFVLSVGVVVFVSLFVLLLWMEYRHEKIILKELENQRKVIFVQVVSPREGREQIQSIQYQRLKEITNHFEETPFRVRRSISGGTMLILLFVFTSGLIFYFFLENSLFRPLRTISRGIRMLGEGDTSFRLNFKSFDEIQELSQEFNQIAEKLEKSYAEIQREAEEIKQSKEQLIHSEKLSTIGQMAAGIAHEMNNPLTGILGYAQLLLSEMEKNNPHYDDIKKIEQETKRLVNITKNLLSCSRPAKLQFEPLNINEIIEQSLGLVHHEMKYKNVEIIKDFANDLPPVKADEGELTQVLVNLLTNAAHAFSDKEKTYKLILRSKANEKDKTIQIEISDTGDGIGKENLDRIFQPFFTTKGKKGSGLGLFVAYGIIQKHRGKIGVRSKLGEGTTFLITLPLDATEYLPLGEFPYRI